MTLLIYGDITQYKCQRKLQRNCRKDLYWDLHPLININNKQSQLSFKIKSKTNNIWNIWAVANDFGYCGENDSTHYTCLIGFDLKFFVTVYECIFSDNSDFRHFWKVSKPLPIRKFSFWCSKFKIGFLTIMVPIMGFGETQGFLENMQEKQIRNFEKVWKQIAIEL